MEWSVYLWAKSSCQVLCHGELGLPETAPEKLKVVLLGVPLDRRKRIARRLFVVCFLVRITSSVSIQVGIDVCARRKVCNGTAKEIHFASYADSQRLE